MLMPIIEIASMNPKPINSCESPRLCWHRHEILTQKSNQNRRCESEGHEDAQAVERFSIKNTSSRLDWIRLQSLQSFQISCLSYFHTHPFLRRCTLSAHGGFCTPKRRPPEQDAPLLPKKPGDEVKPWQVYDIRMRVWPYNDHLRCSTNFANSAIPKVFGVSCADFARSGSALFRSKPLINKTSATKLGATCSVGIQHIRA